LIDLKELLQWVSTVIAICAFISPIVYKFYKLLRSISSRLENLENWNSSQQTDIDTGLLEKEVLLRGVLACLNGLKQQGCNGPVTEGIENIETFLFEQAHTGKSKMP